MNVLVDTNLLLRSLQPRNAHFQPATESLRRLRQHDQLCVTPQNLYELWVRSRNVASAVAWSLPPLRSPIPIQPPLELLLFLFLGGRYGGGGSRNRRRGFYGAPD